LVDPPLKLPGCFNGSLATIYRFDYYATPSVSDAKYTIEPKMLATSLIVFHECYNPCGEH